MSRYLLLDVGAGTLDILVWDDEERLHYKAVVPSPVRTLGWAVEATDGDLLVTGGEMGGGPVSRALAERAKTHRVVMSEAAAATIHHDPEKVRAKGIEVTAAEDLDLTDDDAWLGFDRLRLGDVEPLRLEALIDAAGVGWEFDVVGVCGQDHGVPPPGVDHLAHRHQLLTDLLGEEADQSCLIFEGSAVPRTFNRLGHMAADAATLPTEQVWVMDSGMAAILGARLDPVAAATPRVIVLDMATSHTVGASYADGQLCGFFEYHTKDITAAKLDDLLGALADGSLTHERVIAEGGHGAWMRQAAGPEALDLIVATGPRRNLADGSRYPLRPGAPLGDNMMTGAAGLLAAIRARRGDAPLPSK